MAPHWFELVAWAALAVGFASALVIGVDIALFGNRQHMAIMNLVFPLTALYLGPVEEAQTEYLVIAPLRGQLGQLAPLGDSIRSDTLSVLSFEAGLFGWMALAHYVLWDPPIDSSGHWFMMQIGRMLGFLTSWPVDRRLLTRA